MIIFSCIKIVGLHKDNVDINLENDDFLGNMILFISVIYKILLTGVTNKRSIPYESKRRLCYEQEVAFDTASYYTIYVRICLCIQSCNYLCGLFFLGMAHV